MKKMLMALAVFAFVGSSNVTQAQCSGKTAATVSGKKSCAKSCASKLAANDASIEKRVCEKSGKVSYVRKATCEKSGKTSFTAVQYDAGSKKFVNVAPAADVMTVGGGDSNAMTVAGEKKSCAKSCASKLAANDASIQKSVCEKSGKVSYMRKATCAKSGKVSMTPVKYCADSKKFVNVAPAADAMTVSGGHSDAMTVAGEKKSCAKSCASKLAANDASIEKRVCEKSGKVSYMRKATCAKSGKTSFTAVQYDAGSKKFVNAAPAAADAMLVGGEKKACSKKAGLVSGEKKTCAKSAAAAAKLASNDSNIEAKTCVKSGKVSYFTKQTCAKSGKVSMTPVKYCSDSKKFVNVSPEGEAKSTLTGNGMKACCANAKAAGGKACCAGKGKKACSGKAKTTTMQGSQK